jgi:hypothetical protein
MNCLSGALSEFFAALKDQKAHWYRVFPPDENDADCQMMERTFPSLSSLMMMDEYHVKQIFIHLGLAKQWHQKGTVLVSPAGVKWVDFINRTKIPNMEATIFNASNKRHVYLRIGAWTNKHTPKTPESIWRVAKQNFYPVPKLRISSLALRFVTQVGTIFTFEDLPASDAEKSESDRDGSLTTSSDDNQSSSEENDLSEDKKFERR